MPLKRSSFIIVAITSFLFSLHLSGASYLNSTFAGAFIKESEVGILYSSAALLAIALLIIGAPHFIRRFGSYLFVWILLLVDILALYSFTLPLPDWLLISTFIAYLSANTLILFGLDITFEQITPSDKVGAWRGAYYTIINTSWLIGPLVTGFIVERTGFHFLYKCLLILVVIVLIVFASKVSKYNVHTISFLKPIVALKKILRSKDLSGVFIVNFMLQFFYAIMVIYTPIYLHEKIGFGWDEIGLIFLIMLTPLVLIQYPLGRIADLKIGEKELLIGGIIGMGLATVFLPSIGAASLIIWALALFATRVGAATIEVMSDTYFFKHITEEDTSLLSFYRSMSPLAYVIAPILGGVILFQFGYQALFYTLGALVLVSVLFALRIRDTG